MTERLHSAEISWGFRRIPELFYYKIPDMPKGKDPTLRFNPVKPFDAFFVYKAKFIAVEYKMSKGKSLNQNKLRECQHEGLKKNIEAGGISYIGIFFDHGRGKKFAIFIEYNTFMENLEDSGRMSLANLLEFGILLPRIRVEKRYTFDIINLIKEL